MKISACSKCMRIKVGSNWSQNPSTQLKTNKNVEYQDGCPRCNGEDQEPDNGSSKAVAPNGRGDGVDGPTGDAEEAEVQEVQEQDGGNQETSGDSEPAGDPEGKDAGDSDDGSDGSDKPKKRGRPRGRSVKVDKGAAKAKDPESNPENLPLLPGGDMDEKLGVVANKHHQAIVTCRKLMGKVLLEFCGHLRKIKEDALWKFYSDSWEAYLAMPEIDIDASRSRRLIQLMETKEMMEKQLGHPVDLEGIAEYRLTRGMLPCLDIDKKTGEIKNIEVAEELIEKARTLGCHDWSAEVEKDKISSGGGGGRPPSELKIEAGSPLANQDGEMIGTIQTARADEEYHYLKIKIQTAYIVDDMTIKIP